MVSKSQRYENNVKATKRSKIKLNYSINISPKNDVAITPSNNISSVLTSPKEVTSPPLAENDRTYINKEALKKLDNHNNQ